MISRMIPFIAVILFPATALAATILVPSEVPTIQEGIDGALHGDTVLVAPGTYVERIDFLGKRIEVRSESGLEVTVIDGDDDGTVVTFESFETGATRLEGFTVRNGIAEEGGGIACSLASPRIVGCAVTENRAIFGGGIHLEFSQAAIENCSISDNLAVFGGGIFGYSTQGRITNCTLSDNRAETGTGGGIELRYSDPTLSNVLVVGNVASAFGGGIFCNATSSPTITNCTVSDNIAPVVGGVHCDGGAAPTITNSIVGGNTDIQTSCDCTDRVTYSDVGDDCPGEGNLSVNPGYVGGGDYHLQCGLSPCVDAGINEAPGLPPTDREGGSRICDGVTDMGAFECAGAFCETCIDEDDDGYGSPASLVCPNPAEADCDDSDPETYPGAPDPCDGIDQACDGIGDEGDGDGDGHLACGDDCDDTDPLIHPGAEEICDNGVDDDCDLRIDEVDPDCIVPFTLEMTGAYGEGRLSLDYTLGAPEGCTLISVLIASEPGGEIKYFELLRYPLGPMDPPVDVTIAFPFPAIGWIGVWNRLYAAEGLRASDLDWIDTGGRVRTARP